MFQVIHLDGGKKENNTSKTKRFLLIQSIQLFEKAVSFSLIEVTKIIKKPQNKAVIRTNKLCELLKYPDSLFKNLYFILNSQKFKGQ